jgi:hypothetical protein
MPFHKQYSPPGNGLIKGVLKQDAFLPDRRRDGQAITSQLIDLKEKNRS